MRSILYTGGMVLLWGINLLNGTGLGAVYQSTEYARLITSAAALLLIFGRAYIEGGWYAPVKYFRVLLPMAALFIFISLLNGYGWTSLHYLWVFLVTYVLSQTHPDRKTLYLVGTAYAVLGLAILYIYNYMDTLKGWNPNSIAMIGLFSFLVFTIPFYGARDVKSFLMLTLVGAAYVTLILPTNSRSCSVAIVLDLLLVFRVFPADKLLNSHRKLFLALQVPLAVALIGCLVALTADVEALNAWSIEELGKTFFNGRDQTWLAAFRSIGQNLLFGSGYVDRGIYHNCAVACLVAYGILGYLLWIRLFHLILCDALPFHRDFCVMGAMTAFFVIFWQQSVELGMFSATPSLVPYVVLGLLLGRVKTVRAEK